MSRTSVQAALADAASWAGVALLLAIPMLAWRTIESQSTLQLVSRWPEVAIAVALVFVVRLGLSLWGSHGAQTVAADHIAQALARATSAIEAKGHWLAPAIVGCAAVLPFTPLADRYVMDLAILVVTYIIAL